MKNYFLLLVLFLLAFPHLGSSQDSLAFELSCDVHIHYPPFSITKEKLNEADSIIHLNKKYPSSWIKEYISVEILTSYKGKIKKAVSKNDILSQEQKDIMNMADLGTDISVMVHYIPDNNLKHNDPKEFSFTFSVDPENEAKYPGGEQQLKQYLKENITDKIPDDALGKYQLSAVIFTIDKEGHVIDPQVVWPWDDEDIDKLLLETICNMPNWKPAEYANGTKVKQEFALTLGDMKSCVVNLLNIRHPSRLGNWQ